MEGEKFKFISFYRLCGKLYESNGDLNVRNLIFISEECRKMLKRLKLYWWYLVYKIVNIRWKNWKIFW